MPQAPFHPCIPGCSVLLPPGVRRCPQHMTNPAHGWGGNDRRIRGRQLQRMRDRLFRKQPLCVVCLDQGRTTMATIRDHVIPLAEGGRDDETNEQPLCQACSDTKTHAEAQRGRVRA
jgi:5-methylcytosine-specific restriction protein A